MSVREEWHFREFLLGLESLSERQRLTLTTSLTHSLCDQGFVFVERRERERDTLLCWKCFELRKVGTCEYHP